MKIQLTRTVATLLLAATFRASASDTLPLLRAGDEVYTNVTVTTVTATDIYFSHSKGMGNAKLKTLEPELQKRFKFDPAKGKAVEQQQALSTAMFQMTIAARAKEEKLRPKPNDEIPPVEINAQGEPVAPKLYAKSFRGGPPPQILVEKWITSAPNVDGKFVLLNFWAASAAPCRRAIPHLNELQAKFKDRLVVIGLSDESEADIRNMKEPEINYSVGTDTQGRTKQAVEVAGIPHLILIDPKGIVRFEGLPDYLNEDGLELLINRYGK
jgi:cytochrome c biogenesis protein CcmG, thiol:disulfide interchange protein DsbE